jgi:alkanesulfonate monooxygenase SsuD/methylene tetrahydromethanopterin reductase-like flavin-dependent oxidoreductase (luciferase family)
LFSSLIPICGGGGEQLTLRVAARYAACTNFGPSPEEFARRSEILAGHCRDVGTDFDAIVRSTNRFVVCRETERQVHDALAEIEDRYLRVVPAEQARRATAMYTEMAGTPGQLVERLRPWAAAGRWPMPSSTPRRRLRPFRLELFAREVVAFS